MFCNSHDPFAEQQHPGLSVNPSCRFEQPNKEQKREHKQGHGARSGPGPRLGKGHDARLVGSRKAFGVVTEPEGKPRHEYSQERMRGDVQPGN